MRDQLITLSMRKPSRIKTVYDVPMLVLDDFDTEAMDESVLRLLGDLAVFSDTQTRITMANLCIEKVKLCVCIQNILAAHYSETVVKAKRADLAPDVLLMLTPRPKSSEIMDVIKCEQELDEWNENLPQDCYLRARTLSEETKNENGVLLLHRAVLNMLYLAAVSALHRPHIGSGLSTRHTKPFNLQYLSLQRHRVQEAAVEIVEIVTELQKHDYTRFLPPIGITILLPAMTMHLLELNARPTFDNPSIRRFQQCVEVLYTLQKHIPSGDYAYDFIDAAVRQCNLELGEAPSRRQVQGIADMMSISQVSPAQTEWTIEDAFGVGRSAEFDTYQPDLAKIPGIITGPDFFVDFDAFTDYYNADTGFGMPLLE
jgi:hypothetical protein